MHIEHEKFVYLLEFISIMTTMEVTYQCIILFYVYTAGLELSLQYKIVSSSGWRRPPSAVVARGPLHSNNHDNKQVVL
jgi:hypothetical protein